MRLTECSCTLSGLLKNSAHWCTSIDIYGHVDPWRYLNIPTSAMYFHMHFLPRLDSYLWSNGFPVGISIALRLAGTVSLTLLVIYYTRCDCDNYNPPYEFSLYSLQDNLIYLLHLSTHNFQDHYLVIQLMMWLSLVCAILSHNNQHRLNDWVFSVKKARIN